ncbi:HAAS signaling domain-containing protein [Allosphingosinicella deserti]|uniref:Uncharacterized protein n=1 Tax=Allosphingosinicella deserti TaxID=2116704 RepID=A0A2P7QNN9_9SPHN|nr:hypothetical protein [Sphingomonas deserti]PSJ39560.1 hypothetical protein C7I55_13215 [Sphingomonas deserti]
MTDRLPPEAERFLRRLADALWELASDEREAILLELRGHLSERAAQGPEPLGAALAEIGTAETLAGQFLCAATIRNDAPPAPIPPAYASPRRHDIRALFGELRATLRAGRNGLFLVSALLITVLTSSNFLLWLDKVRPELSLTGWPIFLVRTLVLLLAITAAYRILLSEDERPWTVDTRTLRAAAALVAMLGSASILVLALAGGAKQGALAAGLTAGPAATVRNLVAIAVLISVSCAFLRVQPWVAALAVGRRDIGLKRVWRGTGPVFGTVLRGWFAFVFPFYAAHVAITFLAIKVLPFGGNHLLLAELDAFVSTGALFAALLLNATAFRWVSGEAIPAPRPFGNAAPDAELVAEARRRLRVLMAGTPQMRRG